MDWKIPVLLLFANTDSIAELLPIQTFKYKNTLNKMYLINKICLRKSKNEPNRNGDCQLKRPNLHTCGDAGESGDKRREPDSLFADEGLTCFEDFGSDKFRRAYEAISRGDGEVRIEGVRCPGHRPQIQKRAEREKIRIVADTNVLISASFWFGDPDKIINLVNEGEIVLVISSQIIDEYSKVLEYPDIIEKVKRKKLEAILTPSKIASIAWVVHPHQKLNIIKADPDDNIVLEAALEGFADYIVTQDKHLLSLGKFENIPILPPLDFLEVYKKWTGK